MSAHHIETASTSTRLMVRPFFRPITEGHARALGELLTETLIKRGEELPLIPVQIALSDECFGDEVFEMIKDIIMTKYPNTVIRMPLVVDSSPSLKSVLDAARKVRKVVIFDNDPLREESCVMFPRESRKVTACLTHILKDVSESEINRYGSSADPWTFLRTIEEIEKTGCLSKQPYPQLLITHWPIGGDTFGWYFISSWRESDKKPFSVYVGTRAPRDYWSGGCWLVGVTA